MNLALLIMVVSPSILLAQRQLTCIDLTSTQCGKYGVSFQYPVTDHSNFANLSAIDSYFNDIYDNFSNQLNKECGLNNIDVRKISGYEAYLCQQSWNEVISLAGKEASTMACNNDQPLVYSQVCKSDCQKVLQSQQAYLKKQGCRNPDLTSQSQQIFQQVCASNPVDNCVSLSSVQAYAQSVSDSSSLSLSSYWVIFVMLLVLL